MPIYTNETYKQLAGQTQLPGSDTALYTATALTTLVKHIRLVNPTASAATAKLWHTTGGAGADSSLILPSTTILAGGWAEFDGVIILDSGDAIRGLSGTASAITYSIYGLELTSA